MTFSLEIGISVILSLVAFLGALKMSSVRTEEQIKELRKDLDSATKRMGAGLDSTKTLEIQVEQINKKLDRIEDLHLEAELASIKSDMSYIRAAVDEMRKSLGDR